MPEKVAGRTDCGVDSDDGLKGLEVSSRVLTRALHNNRRRKAAEPHPEAVPIFHKGQALSHGKRVAHKRLHQRVLLCPIWSGVEHGICQYLFLATVLALVGASNTVMLCTRPVCSTQLHEGVHTCLSNTYLPG